ncbi:MAG: sigma-54-dependent Fis family transcriptional regulator [Nitrospirae bacterium]|nr:sigma-54-dependent Fis family transcriptional regulator [Nitrospirota bacterium]
MEKTKILIVDDEKDILRALEFLLSGEGYSVTKALSGEEAVEQIKKTDFDIVLTDLKMEKMDGIQVLEEAKRINPETTVILMTAYASVESAVDAMKKGASEYIVKPFINEEIRLTIKRQLEQMTLKRENIALRQELSQRRGRCREFIFSSESMQKVFDLLEKVIPTKSNVLLLGESGTGKGLIAEIIHCSSQRGDKPFITINCSAIPENLLESELFGYKKGAFTGAVSDKKGLIQMADEGTLFLDEIGDMPLSLQAKLLKVLDSGEATPLGDTKPRHSDIRLISATNHDIEKLAKEGRFREDLFYRINVVEIKLPPLRERKEDIPLLADMFVKRFASENHKNIKAIEETVLDVLLDYPWHGNVRELANVIERAVVITKANTIGIQDLPEKLTYKTKEESSLLREKINEYEKQVILHAYETNRHNKEATASSLGIDLATLYRKMKKLSIE